MLVQKNSSAIALLADVIAAAAPSTQNESYASGPGSPIQSSFGFGCMPSHL